MSEQYQKGIVVMDYLEKLDVHPVTIGEAISNDNFRKSYQLIMDNPKITKEEFLTQMQIEEYEEIYTYVKNKNGRVIRIAESELENLVDTDELENYHLPKETN